MLNLLNETFTRVRKSAAPKVTLIMLLFISFVEISVLVHGDSKMDLRMMFTPFMFMSYLTAYCSSFMSRDYTNGTIRNKIIFGNSRVSIYLANFIVLSVTMLLIIAVYSIITFTAGSVFCGLEHMSSAQQSEFIKKLLILLVNVLAFTSVAAMLGMLCQGVSGTVWSFFIYTVAEIFVMLFNLVARRYFEDDADKLEEFFDYFIPTEQYSTLMYSNFGEMPDDAYKLPLYSCILVALTLVIGIFSFRKKNIK